MHKEKNRGAMCVCACVRASTRAGLRVCGRDGMLTGGPNEPAAAVEVGVWVGAPRSDLHFGHCDDRVGPTVHSSMHPKQ